MFLKGFLPDIRDISINADNVINFQQDGTSAVQRIVTPDDC